MTNFNPVYGAIIGDIAGSNLELKPAAKYRQTDTVLFLKQGRVTDDTVLTIATMEVLYKQKATPEAFRDSYYQYGNEYPGVGYGHNFRNFLETKEKVNSYGNGCLMRLSPIMLLEDWELRKEVALDSIKYTHNHLDSKYGVETYCRVINASEKSLSNLQKDWALKSEIDSYFTQDSFEDLFECHTFNTQVIPTLRDALVVLWSSSSFEEVLWKSLQLGGDTDTIASIACGLAGKVYEIPEEWKSIAESKMPESLLKTFKDCQRPIGI